MEPSKKIIIDNDALENVIIETDQSEKKSVKTKGRPKNKVKKVQKLFYLPENISLAIEDNSFGNKSVFAEKVFEFYFQSKNIDY